MAEVYIDDATDTVYVHRNGEYLVISPDGEPTTTLRLPGYASPMVNEDDVDTEDAYNDGYDAGYSDGQNDTDFEFTQDDLDERYDEGYQDGRNSAIEEKDADE